MSKLRLITAVLVSVSETKSPHGGREGFLYVLIRHYYKGSSLQLDGFVPLKNKTIINKI
jgi:hypothetical protein